MTRTMTPKHTPGPWTAYRGSVWSESSTINKRERTNMVASISDKWKMPDSEKIANARLIAAAPQLLEALKDALESLKRLPDVDGAYRVTCIRQAEIAITSAEGDAL